MSGQVSHLGHFIQEKRSFSTHWARGWVVPRTVQNTMDRRKIHCPGPASNHDSLQNIYIENIIAIKIKLYENWCMAASTPNVMAERQPVAWSPDPQFGKHWLLYGWSDSIMLDASPLYTSRDTVPRFPRRHMKSKNVFQPFPWQCRDRTLRQYWTTFSLMFMWPCIVDIVKGKEPTRCNKVCSFIALTCFGHQYAHHQEYN
jgi:hypothetical protein